MTLMSIPTQKLTQPPCCYKSSVTSNDMMFTPTFMKICPLVQNFLGKSDTQACVCI